jgi:hypothetical protein
VRSSGTTTRQYTLVEMYPQRLQGTNITVHIMALHPKMYPQLVDAAAAKDRQLRQNRHFNIQLIMSACPQKPKRQGAKPSIVSPHERQGTLPSIIQGKTHLQNLYILNSMSLAKQSASQPRSQRRRHGRSTHESHHSMVAIIRDLRRGERPDGQSEV